MTNTQNTQITGVTPVDDFQVRYIDLSSEMKLLLESAYHSLRDINERMSALGMHKDDRGKVSPIYNRALQLRWLIKKFYYGQPQADYILITKYFGILKAYKNLLEDLGVDDNVMKISITVSFDPVQIRDIGSHIK